MDPEDEDSIGSLPDRQAERGEERLPDVPRFELPECLRGTPSEVLRHLVLEDPFELRSRCFRALREAAVLVNPERLLDFAASRIAVSARTYQGAEPVEAWLEQKIEQAIRHQLDEQRAEERRGTDPLRSPDGDHYRRLASCLGIPAADTRMASVVLNELDPAMREAFFAVVVEGLSVEAWAKESEQRPSEVHELLRQVGMIVTAKLVQRDKARKRRRKKL